MTKKKTVNQQEQVKEIKEKERESKAKKLERLIYKSKKRFGSELKIAEFKEPILMLIRSNQKCEFYEGATEGVFKYTHTNGQKKEVILTRDKLIKFQYGKYNFTGYIHDENWKVTMPEKPIIDAEYEELVIDKTLADIKAYKTKEITATFEGWTKLAWALLGGVALIFVIEWISGGAVSHFINNLLHPVIQNAVPIAQQAVQNLTQNTTLSNVTIYN